MTGDDNIMHDYGVSSEAGVLHYVTNYMRAHVLAVLYEVLYTLYNNVQLICDRQVCVCSCNQVLETIITLNSIIAYRIIIASDSNNIS